jgi:hypothetical protein
MFRYHHIGVRNCDKPDAIADDGKDDVHDIVGRAPSTMQRIAIIFVVTEIETDRPDQTAGSFALS